jgi:exodeoxyribonuclease-3
MKPSRLAAPVSGKRPASAKIKVRLKRAPTKSADTALAPYTSKILPPPPTGSLRIATWNINSVRLRLALIKKLARRAAPDVICLQETKTPDEHFPREAFAALGYVHQAACGMKGYNGVAILSRHPLHATVPRQWCDRADCRHLVAEIEIAGHDRIELHNVYVPAGGDIPDPKTNPKFAHKLRFLREQTAWWEKQSKTGLPRILVGDLNVAPFETDVWSHKQLLDVVSHTPAETELLGQMLAAHEWIDVARHIVPEPARMYTWWSYRNRDWKASDRGRRLDHIWVTPALKPALSAVHILKGARDWRQPSDHVPVIIDLTL